MRYVLAEWNHELDDEPYLIYSELDGGHRETRRVEFYRNGITFSYGGERGERGGPDSGALPGGPAGPPPGERRGRLYGSGDFLGALL